MPNSQWLTRNHNLIKMITSFFNIKALSSVDNFLTISEARQFCRETTNENKQYSENKNMDFQFKLD